MGFTQRCKSENLIFSGQDWASHLSLTLDFCSHYFLFYRKGYQLSDIKDVRGIRLIVPDKDSCYEALRVVEGLWESDFNHFKDYIKNPKDNGYDREGLVLFLDGVLI